MIQRLSLRLPSRNQILKFNTSWVFFFEDGRSLKPSRCDKEYKDKRTDVKEALQVYVSWKQYQNKNGSWLCGSLFTIYDTISIMKSFMLTCLRKTRTLIFLISDHRKHFKFSPWLRSDKYFFSCLIIVSWDLTSTLSRFYNCCIQCFNSWPQKDVVVYDRDTFLLFFYATSSFSFLSFLCPN